MSQTVSPGRVVLFTVGEHEAAAINKRRADWAEHSRAIAKAEAQDAADGIARASAHTGYVAHVGNVVTAGDQFPATVVKVWNAEIGLANLAVTLDGTDTYWATSVAEGEGPHTWAWPARV